MFSNPANPSIDSYQSTAKQLDAINRQKIAISALNPNKNISDKFSIPITVKKKDNPSNYYSTSIIFLFVFLVLIIISIFIGLKSKKNTKSTPQNN